MKNVRLILALTLVLSGTWGVVDRVVRSKPRSMTCDEYVDLRPNSVKHRMGGSGSAEESTPDWIELTDCELDIAGMIYEHTRVMGSIKKVFIPVQPLGASHDEATRVVICSTSANDIQLARELRRADSKDSLELSDGALHTMKERAAQHTVRGMVNHDTGFFEGMKLERADGNLSDGFVILDEGRSPGVLPAATVLLAGLCIGLTCIPRRPGLPVSPPLSPAQPPPIPK